MSAGERTEFLASYEEQKSEVFDNRRVLESYCQDDVTVLRQACRVFKANSSGSEILMYSRNLSLSLVQAMRC
jgi:hypothetical protein